jgi:PAS domain S-box
MSEGYAYCKMLFEDNKPTDFIYMDVNAKFAELTGLKDVVGKTVSEVIPGIQESNPEPFECYGRVALTGKPEKLETYVKPLGIWFSVSVYSPGREYFVAVFENVTEPKRMEDELRKSEERFRKIFDESQVGIITSAPDYRFEKINPAFCRMIGYTATELASMTFADITHPDDIRKDIENIKKLGRGEISFYKVEKRYLRKTGETIWGNIVVSSVRNNNGTLLYYLAMIEDITVRKRAEEAIRESEERFRMVFENVFDGISIYSEDPDPSKRRLVECNERYAAMAGRSREELLQLGSTQGLQITLEDTANINRLESLAGERHIKAPSRGFDRMERIMLLSMWACRSHGGESRTRLASIATSPSANERTRH